MYGVRFRVFGLRDAQGSRVVALHDDHDDDDDGDDDDDDD